jgi:hypothetical protein
MRAPASNSLRKTSDLCHECDSGCGEPAAAGEVPAAVRHSANSGSKYASSSSSPTGKQRARLRFCCRSYCKPVLCPYFPHGPKHRSWTFPSLPYRILLSNLLFMKTSSPRRVRILPVVYPLCGCTYTRRHKRNGRGEFTKLFTINEKNNACQEHHRKCLSAAATSGSAPVCRCRQDWAPVL